MLFLNVDLLFKNCLTDRLIRISIIFLICSQSRFTRDKNSTIDRTEVSAKITCVFLRTQENRNLFASKSKCIVYMNKIFGWKSFSVDYSVCF